MVDRTLLVTGGAGFIGTAVIRHLLDSANISIVNLDKMTYAADESRLAGVDSRRYRLVRADIADGEAVRRVFEEVRPSGVLNLAAESHVDRSIDGPADFIHTNVVGMEVLLEASLAYWEGLDGAEKEAFRFLHISTDEVYGSLDFEAPPFTETSQFRPNSPYAASKASSDHLARAWHKTFGLPILVSNCSNNYGPFQFPEKLIPLVTIRGYLGKSLPVYGDGLNVRDWLHVEDHARALAVIFERGRPGETYNIGGSTERSNLEIVRMICNHLDDLHPQGAPHDRLITFVDDRPGHDRRYAIDCSKVKRELAWQPVQEFDSGLRATVAWYLENENWWRRILDGGFEPERLGVRGEGS